MSRPLLTLAVVLLVAPQVRADAAPYPFPVGIKNARVVSKIEITEECPEFTFVVVRYVRLAKRQTEIEFADLKPGRPLSFAGQPHDWTDLFIVSTEAATPYKTPEELVDAIQTGKVSAAQKRFETRESAPQWAGGETTVTYRVQRKKSGGGLEIVRTSWHPLWQWYTAAILFLLAILFGGFWLARRIVRRVRATPAT